MVLTVTVAKEGAVFVRDMKSFPLKQLESKMNNAASYDWVPLYFPRYLCP